MKLKESQPFLFKNGAKAVLLLHGFTGSSADVRILGRFLQEQGYTVYAPQYKGHAKAPEVLLQTTPTDWWGDCLQAYDHLLEMGYKDIAVGGLSLGGLFSLKLGFSRPVKGIISLSTPTKMYPDSPIIKEFYHYIQRYKTMSGHKEEEIERTIKNHEKQIQKLMRELGREMEVVMSEMDMIYAPIMIAQGKKDAIVDENSATFIYRTVESVMKELHWFEKSGHVITLDKEKKVLNQTILTFLSHLAWTI